MEILSFTYLIIELILLTLTVYFAFNMWYLSLIFGPLIYLYPFSYEPILYLIFSINFRFRNNKNHHSSIHKPFIKHNHLVYNPIYNMRVLGIEKSHPFDACKYERVMHFLQKKEPQLDFQNYNNSRDPDYTFLYTHVGFTHLLLMNYSCYLSKIVEIVVIFVPSVLLRIFAVRRFLYTTQGTLTAACLAIDKKWAINIGGGFHHASKHSGSGFCAFNDIGLAIEHLWENHPEIKRILILDLDAHQGNGHARDKIRLMTEIKNNKINNFENQKPAKVNDEINLISRQIFVADMYNGWIYPGDHFAKQGIDLEIKLKSGESDKSYLEKLKGLLMNIQTKFSPDFLIYNAGTDILAGDELGKLNISPQGVIERDEIVFKFATERNLPILMLLSGGYQKSNAEIIADSIINISKKFRDN